MHIRVEEMGEPFSANSESLRTIAICAWPSGDSRKVILRLNMGSCSTLSREPSGMPSLYYIKTGM